MAQPQGIARAKVGRLPEIGCMFEEASTFFAARNTESPRGNKNTNIRVTSLMACHVNSEEERPRSVGMDLVPLFCLCRRMPSRIISAGQKLGSTGVAQKVVKVNTPRRSRHAGQVTLWDIKVH